MYIYIYILCIYIYIIYIYISAKKWRLFEIGHTVAGKFQAPAKIAEVMPRAPEP